MGPTALSSLLPIAGKGSPRISWRRFLRLILRPKLTGQAGLAVVQNIIEQHGGAIKVKSIEGKGAVFTIWLPVIARQQD